jgi:tripeptide aminopeptidase
MFSAHTDTVFPAATPLRIVRSRDRLSGPGVGDNSLGIAAMIGLFTMLERGVVDSPIDLIGVATVGEEGLGNLIGAREAVDRFRRDLAGFVAVEGHNLGRVTRAGVGSQRWRIRVRGPGGHSWGAYGQPSAIHGLARIVAEVSHVEPPRNPKTTFNVGVIEGGVSVNTIAPSAFALLDIRSTSAEELASFAYSIRSIIDHVPLVGLDVEIEIIGERPAGATERHHPLVQAAAAALRELGIAPIFDASSTDANIAMSYGIPAICVGVSRGGNGHTFDEYVETAPIADGIAQLALIVDSAATLISEPQA